MTVTYFVIRSGQTEILELLLDNGADPTAALPTAAWDGHEDVLDLLIARGGKLDEARDGKKPLLNELIRWGQIEKALRLLGRGASPNVPDERGWTAVHQAVSRGNRTMLEAVIAAGGDARRPDLGGRTPVQMAATRAVIRRILAAGR